MVMLPLAYSGDKARHCPIAATQRRSLSHEMCSRKSLLAELPPTALAAFLAWRVFSKIQGRLTLEDIPSTPIPSTPVPPEPDSVEPE